MTRRSFDGALVCATALVVVFLALPLVAVFVRTSPVALFAQLGNPAAVDALLVSLKTSVIAHVFIVGLGTPAAYLLARRRFRLRAALLTLVELPLVLPPAVAGIALLAVFGRRQGLLGAPLADLGVSIPFTQTAVVLAVILVASPFYIRAAIAAFEAVDSNLLDASRTLGVGPSRTFRRVALPLAAGGLGAGATLAFARGLGEFGATIMFAGSLQGRTQTLPLMIYAQLDQDFEVALAVGALLVLVSLAILLAAKLAPPWTRFASTSTFRSATSTSR
ncbi:MAG: molybdate ABC transporter permease subunit [Thermoleophilia bacterium]|nr:molybdate ABC transporter permease subunit [Thermoleophilia bacterium]